MLSVEKIALLAGVAPDAKMVSQGQLTAAVAIAKAMGQAGAIDRVRADAVKAANARVAAIFQHPEAEGRDELASRLAFGTDMSADAVIVALKATPLQRQSRLTGVPNPSISLVVDNADHPGGAQDGGGLAGAVDALVARMSQPSAGA